MSRAASVHPPRDHDRSELDVVSELERVGETLCDCSIARLFDLGLCDLGAFQIEQSHNRAIAQ